MSTGGFGFLPVGCPHDDPDADAFLVRVQQQAGGWAVVHAGRHWDGWGWSDAPVKAMEFDAAVAVARQAAGTLSVAGRIWSEHVRHRP